MRSALIFATFSLSIFAAPVPEAQPIYKSNEIGQHDRPDLNGRVHRREFHVETRSPAFRRTKNAREVEAEVDARSPNVRPKNAREVEAQVDARSPNVRPKNAREVEAQVDARSPNVRSKNGRSIDDEDEESEDTEDLQALYITSADPESESRGEQLRDVQKRSAEPGYHRGPRIVQSKRSAEPGYHRGPRIVQSKRTATPEPGYVRPSDKRTPSPEPGYVRPSDKRTPSPEPGSVRGSNKRTAEPQGVSGPERRDPEPINRSNKWGN